MDDGAHRAGGFGFLAALKNMESLASLLSYLLLLPYSFCSFASNACFSRVLELAPLPSFTPTWSGCVGRMLDDQKGLQLWHLDFSSS